MDGVTITKGVPGLLKAYVPLASWLQPEASPMTAHCCKNTEFSFSLPFSRRECFFFFCFLLCQAEAGCSCCSDLWESLAVLWATGEHCWETPGTSQPLCDKTHLLPAQGLREQPKWERDQEPKAQRCLGQPNHTRAPRHSGEAPAAHRGKHLLGTHLYH